MQPEMPNSLSISSDAIWYTAHAELIDLMDNYFLSINCPYSEQKIACGFLAAKATKQEIS